jgi:hypothetical protein
VSVLHLTPDEQALWNALPEQMRANCSVETYTETTSTPDTPQRMGVRLSLLHLSDPRLQACMQKMMQATSAEEWWKSMLDEDVTAIGDDQWRQMLVAFGPCGLTMMISSMIPNVTDGEDAELIASLSLVRYTLDQSRSAALADAR